MLCELNDDNDLDYIIKNICAKNHDYDYHIS